MAKSNGELILAGDMLAAIEGELQRSPELASEHSRRTYLGALQDFETWRAGRNITKTLVGAYAAHLRDQGLAPATINHKLSAVRWWARRLADLALEAPELTPARRREVAARATAAAGVSNVGWHDFRRTLAGNLLDEGADLATVQRILGHSSPVTTSAYDRRPEETRRKALRSLHLPYWRRG